MNWFDGHRKSIDEDEVNCWGKTTVNLWRKLIDEESWLTRKLIDNKVDWWRKSIDEKVNHIAKPTDTQ